MFSREEWFADPFAVSQEEKIPSLPDDEQPPATRKELWGYYLYYNGNNGYTIYSYLPNILQLLAYRNGFSQATPNVRGCDTSHVTASCNISWLGSTIPVSSMMLYAQSIAFSIQFLLFTTLGSLADYGSWNRYILALATLLGCATQILPVTLINDDGSHWDIMLVIFIIALISYGTSLVFYAAAFPRLSDHLPVVRKTRADSSLSTDQVDTVCEKWRNHISVISTTFSNIGYLVMTVLLSGVSFVPWGGDTLGHLSLYNFIATAICGGYWLINALPYFIYQPKGRSGPPLPDNENHFSIGLKSIYIAFKEIHNLCYLFMYLLCYFMFSDAVNTTNQMISIIQGEITSFSAQQVTFFNLVSAIMSIVGCLAFLWISKAFAFRTKTSLLIIVCLSAVVPLWGCFGIKLDHFGLKTQWELWAVYIWTGLFTAPIWAWQQTLLAQLVPKGKENLFFGLFGIVNKASSWVGPMVIGAITQQTSNLWLGWPFILSLFVISIGILFCIDMDKAKQQVVQYQCVISEKDTSKVLL